MKSSDWLPMDTAPLNKYGDRWGPVILIWCKAIPAPVAAYFDPWFEYQDQDCGPGWICHDSVGDSVIAPEDAAGWMEIAAPLKLKRGT